jgi:hypothetical protein
MLLKELGEKLNCATLKVKGRNCGVLKASFDLFHDRYCIGTAFVESRNDLHVDALLDVDRTNSSQKKQQRWYWKFPQPLTRPSDE